MRRRKVDRYKLALIKAAELDDSGFDWRGIDLSDPHVKMLADQDHGKGVRHPGLGCCG
jgi:hypothetical protein